MHTLRDAVQEIPPIQNITNVQNVYGMDRGTANDQFTLMTSAILTAARATISDDRNATLVQTVAYIDAVTVEVRQQAMQYAQSEVHKISVQHSNVIAQYEQQAESLNISLTQVKLQAQETNTSFSEPKT